MSSCPIACTRLGPAPGSLELAAALAVTAACAPGSRPAGALLIELGDRGPCKPSVLATAEAREIEQALAGIGARAAARGRICHLRLRPDPEGVGLAAGAVAAAPGRPRCIVHVPPDSFRSLLEHPVLRPQGVLLRADLAADRSLAALLAGDLNADAIRARVAKRPLGWFAGRLALAGLPPPETARRPNERLFAGLLRERRERVERGPAADGSEDDNIMLGSFYGHYPDEERA